MGVFPAVWVGLFSQETPVREAGGTYLDAVAPFYAAVGTTFILSFVSQGALGAGKRRTEQNQETVEKAVVLNEIARHHRIGHGSGE